MAVKQLPSEVDVIRRAALFSFILVLSLSTIERAGYTGDNLKDESRSAEIIELLELIGSYKLSLQSITQVMNAVHASFNRKNPEKKISDEIWAKVVDDVMSELHKDGYYKMMVPIYEKYLTAEDVREITAFYKTNAGRKFASVMPHIMKDADLAAQEWSKKAMQRIIPKIKKRLREMGYPDLAWDKRTLTPSRGDGVWA